MAKRRHFLVLIGLVSMSMIAVFIAVDQSAVSAAVPSAAARPSKVDSAPDHVSAMIAARAQHSRVEDLAARTSTTATYANPDSTWTVEAYSGVVRSRADRDHWVSVDADVERKGQSFRPVATPFGAEYSAGGDQVLGSVSTESDSTIQVGWPTRLPKPSVSGDSLTYPHAVPNGDLVVGSHADGFDYSIVLDQAPAANAAPLEYRIPLRVKGATISAKSDGSIAVMDGKNRVATMTAPLMWDHANAAVEGQRHAVDASVEGDGDSRVLVLRPDMKFLTAPTTVYPVTVDPTVTLNVAYDTWLDSLSPTASQISSPELRVGSNNSGANVDRTYLYFDLTALSSAPAGVLNSAQLQVSDFATGSCTGSAVRMSQVTGSYNIATMTWATQPATTSTGSSTSTASYGATGCTSEGTMTFDATAIYNAWLGGAFNWGVQLKADSETAASGFRKLRSTENGDSTRAPKLVINYNAYPYKATSLSFSPGSVYGSTNYVPSTTPTLTATVSDPDAGALRGYFEVYNSAGTTLLWSGTSAWSTSGSQVSTAVPASVLVNGTSYQVRVYGQDASLKSQTALAKTIVIDTSAPVTTVTSSGYTNNVWTDPTPASNTFTFDGPTDTATFEAVLDGVPNTYYANSSGDFSFPFTYVAEWHVFQVAAVDKAGNRGPTTTFSFGSGAPGFTTPRQNQATTSSFPLDLSGPPAATSATLSWKLQGETSWRSMGSGTVTKSGSAWTGAVTTSGGRSTTGALLWNVTSEQISGVNLAAPAVVNLRSCFSYTTGTKCTYSRTLQLVPSAFGDSFPTASLGPASVAISTGEARIDSSDASDSKAGLGRTFSSFDESTLSSGLFGPGWSDPTVLQGAGADAKASVVDNRLKDGSFVIIDPDGGTQTFVPVGTSTTNYVPLVATGDATTLTYSVGPPNKLVLVRPLGQGSIGTSWTLKTSDTGGSPAWTVDAVDPPGTGADIGVESAPSSQRPTFIRESAPGVAATCNATTQSVGCRGLAISYTGTGAATRVSTVSRVIGATSAGGVITKVLATYNYDSSGALTSACSAVPSAGKPALCTGYAYSTVAGRTVLSELQPPGLKKWRFAYDSTGRLTTVKRELPSGSGDSTWSVDYSLGLTSSGLPDLSAAAAGQWGQQTVPTKVFAVYQPYLGVADVSKAHLYYTTNDGTTTNTASYGPSGWLVETGWYDANGNEVQHLDGNGWARVQAAVSADRQSTAAQASSYVVYNTWGDANSVGTRAVDVYGPAQTATLKNGTVGTFREHTHNMYDDDPNVDPSLVATKPSGAGNLGLIVKTTTSASDVAKSNDYDKIDTTYGYDSIDTAAGDASGWVLGVPTKVTKEIDATTNSVEITRYDTSGRVIEARQPGGTEDASHAGSDTHSTVTTYYSATGSGDCGMKPAWDGLVCKVGPAAQPSGSSVPTAYTTAYDDDLQPITTLETSGLTTRTTTTTLDAIDRVTGVVKAVTGSGATNETISTTYGFDDSTGLPTTVSSGSGTVTTGYDSWGRATSYTDAIGNASTTTYDAAGNVATVNDGGATYTYTYDGHGFLGSVDTGGGVGTFSYTYTTPGDVDTVTYPNGVVSKRVYNEVGDVTSLAYSQGSTRLIGFNRTLDAGGNTVARSSIASSQQFLNDGIGRLTQVSDTGANGCTTRTYGFDASSDRSSLTTYAPGSTGACQTTTAATTKSSAYDAAGRITNSGYSYDTLGRTLTAPQSDTGTKAAGALTATYHANDMVASLSQSVKNSTGGADATQMTYALEPSSRIGSIVTSTNGVESGRLRYRYASTSDSPSYVDASSDGGTTWSSSRYVSVPVAKLSAVTTGGVTGLVITDLGGDVAGTMPATSGTSTLNGYNEYDEYGVASSANTTAGRYGWLGEYQRSGDALGGLTLMGARLSNPATGSFLSTDPVRGGNSTAYTYPQSPVDSSDLSGRVSGRKYDSKIPTYDYWRVWFNKRETYKIAFVSGVTAALLGIVAAVVSGPASQVIGVVAGMATVLVSIAADAEHDGKCLAFSIYVQRKYVFNTVNPPGPDVFPRTIYKTNYHCTGSYYH